jgi:hypothetical protein
MAKACGTCFWAEWKMTRAGRRNSRKPGECTYPLEIPEEFPACYDRVILHKSAIWTTSFTEKGCPYFTPIPKRPRHWHIFSSFGGWIAWNSKEKKRVTLTLTGTFAEAVAVFEKEIGPWYEDD